MSLAHAIVFVYANGAADVVGVDFYKCGCNFLVFKVYVIDFCH